VVCALQSGKGALICAISSLRRAIQIALSLGSSGSLLARQTRAHEFAKRSDDHWASALQENNIAPLTIELPDPLLDADAAKAAAFVEPEACFVLGEDSGLRRGGGGGKELDGQCCSPSWRARTRRASGPCIDRVLGDTGVDLPFRDASEDRPAQDLSRRGGHQAMPGSCPSLQPSHVGNAVSSVASRVSMPSW
jgi:hypothetical protein